jgi:hypothetical protein
MPQVNLFRRARTGNALPARSRFGATTAWQKGDSFRASKALGLDLVRVTIFKMSQPGEQPHCEKRNRGPESPARFCHKTAAARPKNAIHFRNRSPSMRQNCKEPRGYEDVEGIVRVRKFEHVVALEPAVVQAKGIPFLPGPTELARRSINAQDRNLGTFPPTHE